MQDISSLYPQPPKVMNPLEMQQGYAALQHARGANQLQQAEIGAQKELSDIFSNSVNPETGTVDWTKAFQLAKNSKFSGLNAAKIIEMRNAQDAPEQVFDANSGKNVLRTRQALQREAQLQGRPLQNQLRPALMQPQPIQDAPPREDSQTQEVNLYQPGSNEPMGQGDAQPQYSQEEVDEAHNHLDTIKESLKQLVEDPQLDHKKVMKAVVDLRHNPNTKLTQEETVGALSQLYDPQTGQPYDGNTLRQKIVPMYQQIEQASEALRTQRPSSHMLRARENVGQLASFDDVNQPEGLSQTPSPGYSTPLTKSRETYDQVRDQAITVPDQLHAYNEVINLANSGAKVGTITSDLYKWAARNIPGVPEAVSNEAEQTQIISKYLGQALINQGMPASDARLQALQDANANPGLLIDSIKKLAPALKAKAEGAKAKLAFYNRVTDNGKNLQDEPEAAELWTNNFDPRWIELENLPDNKKRAEFLVSHPDLRTPQSLQKYDTLVDMGVVKGIKRKQKK